MTPYHARVAGRLGPRAAAPLALTLAIAICTAGCAAAATASPTLAPATATPVPTLATSLPLDLCANTGVDCALQPGQYLAQQFQPPIGFTLLDDQWDDAAYVERAIQLVRRPVDEPPQSISIVSGQLDGPTGAAAEAGTTAAQFLTYVRKLSGLTVSGQAALLVGGQAATQVDVKVGKANVTLFNLPLSATIEDPVELRAGETARLVVVDVAGQRVVFVIEVFGTATMADFLATLVQPFLASVTFQPTP